MDKSLGERGDIADQSEGSSEDIHIKPPPGFKRDMPTASFMTSGKPIILAKPHPERATLDTSQWPVVSSQTVPTAILSSSPTSVAPSSLSASKMDSAYSTAPRIVLKSGTSSSLTTSQPSPPMSIAAGGDGAVGGTTGHTSHPVYQLQRHPTVTPSSLSSTEGNSKVRLAAPTEMTRCVNIVDDNAQWCEHSVETLLDHTDFLTIGVIGPQGVGKSTLMSLLAGGASNLSNKSYVFRPQGRDVKEKGIHQTLGIDMYVTSERIILLDSQPVLSCSVLDYIIHKKMPLDYTSIENYVEIQSLQVVSFLMTVCNVILLVFDWFIDPQLLKLLHRAEMLKPVTPSSGHDSHLNEGEKDHFPHLVFVMNKAQADSYGVDTYTDMQDVLRVTMSQSKLHWKGHLGMWNGNFIKCNNKSTRKDEANFIVLPEMEDNSVNSNGTELSSSYRGHPKFDNLLSYLHKRLLSLPRLPIAHTTLSEKNWFQYAIRSWETMKKSQLFTEFNKLIP